MEATELEDKLEPGETIIQFFDDNDGAVILTRSPKEVARHKGNPKATLLRDIEGEFAAYIVIPKELVRFRVTPPDSAPAKPKTVGGNRWNRGNYVGSHFVAAFDPDK